MKNSEKYEKLCDYLDINSESLNTFQFRKFQHSGEECIISRLWLGGWVESI